MHMIENGAAAAPAALAFALAERRHCVSDREWAHRLRGYGYAIRQTGHGRMLTTITGNVEIGALDA